MRAVIVAVLVLVAAVALAADAKKEKPVEKYEVSVTIVYNEVPSDEAVAIAARAHEQFKDTCKHEIRLKKVTPGVNFIDNGVLFYRGSGIVEAK